MISTRTKPCLNIVVLLPYWNLCTRKEICNRSYKIAALRSHSITYDRNLVPAPVGDAVLHRFRQCSGWHVAHTVFAINTCTVFHYCRSPSTKTELKCSLTIVFKTGPVLSQAPVEGPLATPVVINRARNLSTNEWRTARLCCSFMAYGWCISGDLGTILQGGNYGSSV